MSIALASFLDRFFLGKKRYNRESWAESEGNVATHIHIQTQRRTMLTLLGDRTPLCWGWLWTLPGEPPSMRERGWNHEGHVHHWPPDTYEGGWNHEGYIHAHHWPRTLMRGVGIMNERHVLYWPPYLLVNLTTPTSDLLFLWGQHKLQLHTVISVCSTKM